MSGDISKTIHKFCRKLTLEYQKDEFNYERDRSRMVGYVPDDIDIDRSKGDSFDLYGKYYRDYCEVFEVLRDELSLEYLKP